MKFTIDDKTLRRILIGVAVVAVILIIIFFRRRSKFEWPTPSNATGGDKAKDDVLTAALNAAQDAYNVTMIGVNAMQAGPNKTTAILNAEKTLSDSIDLAVQNYVRDKCTAVVDGIKPATDPGAAAWDAYQLDLSKIGQAYYPIVKTATGTAATETLAARKADITGATRKYIATACPNFYKTAAGDDSTTYKNWTWYETEAAYTSAAAPATGTKTGFAKDRITVTNIGNWADYAATTYMSSTSVSVSAGTTQAGPITLTSAVGLNVGDSVQVTPQTSLNGVISPIGTPITATIATISGNDVTLTIPAAPATGYIFPSKTVFAKALRPTSTKWRLGTNWKLARDAGPGTLPVPTWA